MEDSRPPAPRPRAVPGCAAVRHGARRDVDRGAGMTLDTAITELRRAMTGEVLTPDDDGFDQARAEAIWNADIQRQPGAIVRPTSPEEVARVVSTARSEGVDLTVRGGGHS